MTTNATWRLPSGISTQDALSDASRLAGSRLALDLEAHAHTDRGIHPTCA
jgi:hypothetical protein